MKRTRQLLETTVAPIKKLKTVNLDKWQILDTVANSSNPWISATKTKNYLLKDPVLDWIQKYYFTLGFGERTVNKTKISRDRKYIAGNTELVDNVLFKKGHKFEDLVIDTIREKLGHDKVVKVIDSFLECTQEKTKDTIKYLEAGVPIITQAVLYNEKNKTYGIADILIRSDYINQIIEEPQITPEEEKVGCSFSDKYHYRVIDVKWAQLALCSDGQKILNSERYPAYKGQLAVYNLALGKLQNYIPDIAYILGKSYKYESKKTINVYTNSFDKLGHIDFNTFDSKYIELTHNAINWYRDMLTNGKTWNLITSTKPELFPNMCNTQDMPYTSIKQELAIKKNEITCLWRVGIKNRDTAISNNIYSWTDDKCNSKNLGISKNIAHIIDNILEINKSKTHLFHPTKITSDMYDWRNTDDYIDFYVDFETINDIFYIDEPTVKNNKTNNYIFMAGIGYYDEHHIWQFKEFHMEKLNTAEEIRIINQFRDFVKLINNKNKKVRFFHWSNAETMFLENFNDKNKSYLSEFLANIEFADLYKLFIDEPITIKGALSYKLKDVAKALYNNKIITANYSNIGISNGLRAMMDGCEYYKAVEKNLLNNKLKESFSNIIKYNEIDCKVMGEIVMWMRNEV